MSSMAYSIGCVPAEFPRTFRLRRSGIPAPGYGSASPPPPIGLGRC